MPAIPYTVNRRDHPGSSFDDIWQEPDWSVTSSNVHRIGYYHHGQNRRPGLTHGAGDEADLEAAHNAELAALKNVEHYQQFEKQAKHGEHLLNFRDLMEDEREYHDQGGFRSKGQRYVVPASEDWVKNVQEWPANIEKRKKLEEQKASQKQDEKAKKEQQDRLKSQNDSQSKPQDSQDSQHEHDWRRSNGEHAHNDAYTTSGGDEKNAGSQALDETKQQVNGNQDGAESGSDNREAPKSEFEKLRERYSPQEITLLRMLQHDRDYIAQLQQSDGRRVSPMKGRNRTTIELDEADQFTPDNWIPRSKDLIRATGKHPLNAEPDLNKLFAAGLVTPNELHYVRNHGSVPRLRWETHTLDIEHSKLILTMDQLRNGFDTINIPVALACDGNRRKELNLISRTKGFNWAAGAISCSYWKGPLLRDVLKAAGLPESLEKKEHSGVRHYVNFEGSDDCSEGVYATSIAFQYVMNPTNDVILAYEMNDAPIPPDHGYPLRVVIPGYVGGRSVKWLSRIWISDKENDSHYHIWDNRVLPSFIKEKDGAFANSMFHHPDTACMEQNLNSAIVKPAHGEKIPLKDAKRGNSYRVQGYAYDGGGHEVQRVEISLDGGDTWLYCLRTFPEAPIRHDNKFWSWLHWHIDVEVTHLVRAQEIIVRCFNVFKNTQPAAPVWNVMGMMNNGWYRVKVNTVNTDDNNGEGVAQILHPTEPASSTGGWMEPSQELQIAAAKQQAGTPGKQFTRQEIEKHDTAEDCWLVVDGQVYDVTSVLEWHPGGAAAILGHAGQVHQQTTDEFSGIHDDYAWSKLRECALGVVTDRAKALIKQSAEEQAEEEARASKDSGDVALQKRRWVPAKLKERKALSEDTRQYVFSLPEGKSQLGIGTCQHVQVGFHMEDRMIIRSYTPIRPVLPPPPSSHSGDKNKLNGTKEAKGSTERVLGDATMHDLQDGLGEFTMVVKTYFPNQAQPGGALSNILDCMSIGEYVELRGPVGDIEYSGNGKFNMGGQERHFKRISLVLGGSGITPGFALLVRVLLTADDKTELRVIDANKSEKDILLKDQLDELAKECSKQVAITYVLSHPDDGWKGPKGHVNKEIIQENLFKPDSDSVALLCGPPAMIQKAALPALTEWGYKEGENCFGF